MSDKIQTVRVMYLNQTNLFKNLELEIKFNFLVYLSFNNDIYQILYILMIYLYFYTNLKT